MWVISQLNLNDGVLKNSIVSTQFLIKVAQIVYSSELEIDAKIAYENEKQTEFHVDKLSSNKNFNLPANVRNLRVFANGTGLLNVAFVFKFSTFIEKFLEKFSLSVETKMLNEGQILHLIICTHKMDDESDDEEENNDEFAETIMEINLPKGFVK
jgi:hypothetical protein